MAKAKKFLKRVLILSIVLLLALGILQYFRPLPALQPTTTLKIPAAESVAVALPWPNYGQAAVGAAGFGVLETHGLQKSAPIASVTKIMTAYSLLKRRPLNAGEQGPLITITDTDVTIYKDYYSKNGSVAKVTAGEQISEYQALQAMLLPSANNFADTLANWGFGSLDKYIEYANDQAQSLGMKDTHISDASGFSPQTMSSARDLVILGEAALTNPVLADIVSQQQATVPEAGLIKNTNRLLGTDGINGIKTGNTDEAGGCYLFSSVKKVGDQDVTVIGAIMGAPQLNNAISDSVPLIDVSGKDFKTITPIKAGQKIGYYLLPWGGQADVVAKDDLSLLTWQSQKVQLIADLNPQASSGSKGSLVGRVAAGSGKNSAASQAVLAQKIPGPSWHWRIFNR
jgi:D-alanyl-D-alanine carboxypeptidase (penicillin-binding protein 5/6)